MRAAAPHLERDLGRLEARLAALESDVAMIASDMREIRTCLQTVRGGWIALGLVVTVSTGIGALLAKVWPVLAR